MIRSPDIALNRDTGVRRSTSALPVLSGEHIAAVILHLKKIAVNKACAPTLQLAFSNCRHKVLMAICLGCINDLSAYELCQKSIDGAMARLARLIATFLTANFPRNHMKKITVQPPPAKRQPERGPANLTWMGLNLGETHNE
jgi:hypothetical protein